LHPPHLYRVVILEEGGLRWLVIRLEASNNCNAVFCQRYSPAYGLLSVVSDEQSGRMDRPDTNMLNGCVVSDSIVAGTDMSTRRHVVGQFHDKPPDHRCEPADPAESVTDRLNKLLQNGGDGYVLRLCPSQVYSIQAPITFAHPNQEISTAGYPTGDERAVLSVSGPISDGVGHTTAVSGTCSTCNGVKLRNVQVSFIFFLFSNRHSFWARSMECAGNHR
jgi:hypothetical protein